MQNDIKKWIRLVEAAFDPDAPDTAPSDVAPVPRPSEPVPTTKTPPEDEPFDGYASAADQMMAKLTRGDSGCWINDDGDIDICSMYTHSDAAESHFGLDGWNEIDSEELAKRHASVIPPGWDTPIPTDIAMLHGWIRAGFNKGNLYAQIIKGRPAPQARKTFLNLVKTVEPLVKEYSLDYNVNDDHRVSQSAYHGPDMRRFIAAFNAK
jgi:hypothetical protein